MNNPATDNSESAPPRFKQVDESFCSACGNIIKSEAMFCPKCGVQNKAKVVSDVENNRTNLAAGGPKPKGSWGVFILWLLLLWPGAIIYYFMRRWD